MGIDTLRTLKVEIKIKIRELKDYKIAKGQYINILHGFLGDSVLARIETGDAYDRIMFHNTDADKNPQMFLQLLFKAVFQSHAEYNKHSQATNLADYCVERADGDDSPQ